MSAWVSIICILIGTLFILIAAIGILRMPDILIRMHAATKAGTLGAGLTLIGVVLHFQKWNVTIEGILTILFIFITAPIASHLLAKAAYSLGIQLTKMDTDELKSYYNRKL